MIDAFVDDGDIVVLEAVPEAEDGQMVAAWLIDEQKATLKRIYRGPDRVRLQPCFCRSKPYREFQPGGFYLYAAA